MDAGNESCPAKLTLLVAWQNAAQVYSQAVAELTRKIGTVSKAEYEKLSHAAEETRNKALQAQADLEAHIVEHRCDDGGEAAA
jgi:hypothetical protein